MTGSPSPDPDMSATAAFLASSDMSRTSTAQSASSEREANLQSLASLGLDRSQLSEQEERSMALQALEGRLTAETDTIELPTMESLSPAAMAAAANAASKADKRASWNGNPLADVGGKGATNLGMLVEEEEEEDSEGREFGGPKAPMNSSMQVSPRRAPPSSATNVSNASRKQRPSSLIFPPSRSLPFGENHGIARRFNSPMNDLVSPTEQVPPPLKMAPRALSLSSSVSSPSLTDNKALRRLSGLRSLTLSSPEHGAAAAGRPGSPAGLVTASGNGPAGRKRLSLVSASPASTGSSSARPFSASSTSSFALRDRDDVVSPDGNRSFQLGSGSSGSRIRKIGNSSSSTASLALSSSIGPGNGSLSMSLSSATGSPARSRASLAYRSTNSPVSAANTSYSTSTSPKTAGKRYSEMSFASSAGAFGFGDLVMEESVAEEDEEDCDMRENDDGLLGEDVDMTEKVDLLKVNRTSQSLCIV